MITSFHEPVWSFWWSDDGFVIEPTDCLGSWFKVPLRLVFL